MRAAIYARYSSDLQREASIEDQVRLCRERIQSNSWTLVEVYCDRAISGATIGNRAGLQSLLSDAKAGKFNVVVSEALDRLSRDQEDMAAIYKRLHHWEISILTLAEGEVNELHIGLKGTMNALFLKDLAAKIRRGQRGRIAQGCSAGGLSYGYGIVRELDANGNVVRGKRAIDAEQAKIVRRIFGEYVAGKSPRAIASDLNLKKVPSPRGGQWNASTINGHRARRNGILQNELYVGLLIYNRVRMVKDPETGKRVSRVNPHSEWIVNEIPNLRIVSDEAWNDVQAIKSRYSAQPAHKNRRPKRLLSGLLQCGECGGGFTIVRPGKYGCSAHREKGTCSNQRQIMAETLEKRVLAGTKDRLLRPDMLAEFIKEFRRELKQLQASQVDNRADLQRRLANTDAKIQRIVAAIADGTDSSALRQKLMQLESMRADLVRSSEHADELRTVELHPCLPDIYRKKVEALESMLNQGDATSNEAAILIRALIDRIVLLPGKKRGETTIEVYGEPGAILALASGNSTHNQLGMCPTREIGDDLYRTHG